MQAAGLGRHIIRELGPEVPAASVIGDHHIHELAADRQHLVLTLTQLVDERGAPLRVLPAVEAVQFGRHRVQLLVRIVELSQK